ncbi:hypothetical protein TD95_003404 [Thielaviopsis punctulata]|uniref:Chitin-binding type-1 domain-containing protein n=1 Tax=Thielaviopsis punctulata TaxID=72032 RepID=A0A0F4ZFV6_9PEZI|nr:hypothetical protein TD95_003404 [Thielaviopsis punctulata]
MVSLLLTTLLFGSASARLTHVPPVLARDTLPVSSDGRCGLLSETTCAGSIYGSCCSPQNWCGFTDVYCLTGCQEDFGECGSEWVKTAIGSPSTPSASSTTVLPSSTAETTSSSDMESSKSTQISPPTITPSSSSSNNKSEQLNTILGGVFGTIGAICALISAWYAYRVYKKRASAKAAEDEDFDSFSQKPQVQTSTVTDNAGNTNNSHNVTFVQNILPSTLRWGVRGQGEKV